MYEEYSFFKSSPWYTHNQGRMKKAYISALFFILSSIFFCLRKLILWHPKNWFWLWIIQAPVMMIPIPQNLSSIPTVSAATALNFRKRQISFSCVRNVINVINVRLSEGDCFDALKGIFPVGSAVTSKTSVLYQHWGLWHTRRESKTYTWKSARVIPISQISGK